MHAIFTRKNKEFSRQYDRKFRPSYTTSQDGITCLGKCHSQSHSAWWHTRAKKLGNSIYQTHVSQFSAQNWTFKTADEFSLSHLFRFTISTVQLLGQDPFYDTASLCQMSSCITAFCRIFLISGDINRILWNKCLLLCINLGRKALPPSAIFERCAFS